MELGDRFDQQLWFWKEGMKGEVSDWPIDGLKNGWVDRPTACKAEWMDEEEIQLTHRNDLLHMRFFQYSNPPFYGISAS